LNSFKFGRISRSYRIPNDRYILILIIITTITTVLWNQGIQTDREVLANRPDIIIKNKDKTCLLIDVAIPSDKNVIQKEAEKKLKYKNLNIEIQRMWNMKCFVIPVIIGATGIVSKSLQKYLEIIPGHHSIDSLQKTSILGTSHIIRKMLQAET
jgi:hypothetical protein